MHFLIIITLWHILRAKMENPANVKMLTVKLQTGGLLLDLSEHFVTLKIEHMCISGRKCIRDILKPIL